MTISNFKIPNTDYAKNISVISTNLKLKFLDLKIYARDLDNADFLRIQLYQSNYLLASRQNQTKRHA